MDFSGIQFDHAHSRTVYADAEPELFELAEAAIFDTGTNGIFTYQGKLWQVGKTTLPHYLEIAKQVG